MKKVLLATLSVAAIVAAAPATAADLMLEEVPVEEAIASGGSLDGAYFGVFGTYYPDFPDAGIGLSVGMNFLPSEGFLLGLDASASVFQSGVIEGWLKGKAGFGADSFALYGYGEVGAYSGGGLWGYGAGAEFAFTENLSLFGEVGMREEIGDTPDWLVVQGGLHFYFD